MTWPTGEPHQDGTAPAVRAIGGRKLALFLGVLAVLPYANALRAGFTGDARPQIRESVLVTAGVDVWRIFGAPVLPGHIYRPFTTLTFAVNEMLAPANAVSFHATNVLLHAAVTMLVFLLARQLFRVDSIAGIAAALFAVHPIHTEAVTGLVGRAEILATLFGLLALCSALGAMDEPRWKHRASLEIISLAAFCLALLSNESALTVLPLLVLVRITGRGEPWRRGLRQELRSLEWVPYALCAGLFLCLRSYVVSAVSAPPPLTPLNNMLAFVPLDVRISSAIAILWDYFQLLLLPTALTADYSYDQVPLVTLWIEPRFVAGVALIAGTATLVMRHVQPTVRFAAIFPFVAFALTANLLFPIGTIKAERLLYFPSVGWVFLAAYAIERVTALPRYRSAGALGLAFTIALFGARTWERNRDWRNDATLYRSLARVAPDSAKSRHGLGIVFQHRGLHEAAIAQFERALAIYPYPQSASAIAWSYEQEGRVDDAVRWYKRALHIAPDWQEAHTNLCHLLWSKERFEEAIRACRNGLRYAPASGNLLKLLGFSLVGTGATDKGAEILRRSLVVAPDDELMQYLVRLR